MLSYQHGYHAGNHGDILKHLCWLAVINKLKAKDKGFTLIDTHAGAGCYDLSGEQANKTKEYLNGIQKLASYHTEEPLSNAYLKLVGSFYKDSLYPGSPVLAGSLLRPQDTLHCMELHPGEHGLLKSNIKRFKRAGTVAAHFRDGLEGVVGLSPPKPNRGAILIDPPYESANEYSAVENAVKQCLKKWPQAQILIWYPLLSSRAEQKQGMSEAMCHRLAQFGHETLQVELTVGDNHRDAGMYGSGICFINPAWQIDLQIDHALQKIVLGLGTHAQYTLTWLNRLDS